jgi:hypothetical protein
MAEKPPVALERSEEGPDARRYSPSAARNREPIRDNLAAILPQGARILEVASGTGEHGAFCTQTIPDLNWTLSDIDPEGLASQRAWKQEDTTGRLHGPLTIDAATGHWGDAEVSEMWDAIFSANMIHIAPWRAAEGLIHGAGRLIAPAGCLVLYGPFAREGALAPSNAAFRENLKSRNPEWGVRDLDLEVVPLASSAGLRLESVHELPANNLIAVFRR